MRGILSPTFHLILCVFQNIPATRSGRGNHSHYKLYLGWQHYQDGTYKIVTVKKGGGIRQITYETDKPLSLETIKQEGKNASFHQVKVNLENVLKWK